MVSIKDSVDQRWCRSRMVSIKDGVGCRVSRNSTTERESRPDVERQEKAGERGGEGEESSFRHFILSDTLLSSSLALFA